jgi:hypothetical protein
MDDSDRQTLPGNGTIAVRCLSCLAPAQTLLRGNVGAAGLIPIKVSGDAAF